MSKILTTVYLHSKRAALKSAKFALVITSLCVVGSAQGGSRGDDGTTPLGMQPGSPAGSYALSGFETVNPYNGGLNFALPLLHLGGRGGAQFTMTLKRELKWKVEASPTGPPYIFRPTATNWTPAEPGYGPGLVVGRVVGLPGFDSCPNELLGLTRLTFITPDGTEYEFRDATSEGQVGLNTYVVNGGDGQCINIDNFNRRKVFITRDGTSATFISETDIRDYYPGGDGSANVPYLRGYMFMADGTCYRIYDDVVQWIRDRNGNKITFTYDPNILHRVTGMTDSLGRVVTISYSSSFDTITYKGFGGATRTIRVYYDNLENVLRFGVKQTYAELFPNLNGSTSTPFNPRVVSTVELPDLRRYEFLYNPYGELSRVKLPTGGGFEYDWDVGIVGNPGGNVIVVGQSNRQIYRRVVERRVYKSFEGTPVLEGKMTYSRPEVYPVTITNVDVKVEHYLPGSPDQLQSREWHSYYGTSYASFFQEATDYPKWKDGKEYVTETVDSNGSTLLQRLETTWEQLPLSGWWGSDSNVSTAPPINTRAKESKTTWMQTNQVAKQEYFYDQYNNKTEVKEYDFGTGAAGSLVRRSVTSYLTTNLSYSYTTVNPNNTNPDASATIHIRNLPLQSSVYDAGTEKSRTTYEYDNYTEGLTNRSLITGHASRDTIPTHTYTFTPRGNVTQVANWDLPSTGLSTRNQYDIAGNVVKTTDPRNYSTYFEFNDRFGVPDNEAQGNNQNPPELSGGLSTFAFATKVTNALNQIAYSQFDYYMGKAVNGEDANAVVAKGSYADALDRATELVVATNTGLARRTRFVYTDSAKTITTYSDQNVLNDDALRNEIVYDGLGRTIESRQYAPEGVIKTLQEYDAMGRASKAHNPHRNTTEDTYGYSVTSYDGLSRVRTLTTYDKNNQSTGTVTTDYSGNQTTVTDQAGKKRRSVVDGLGRLKQVDELLENGNLYATTTYGYDVLDDLVSTTQVQQNPPATQTRTFAYDSLKRLKQASNPESGALNYDYDNNSNLWHKTDARSITTTFAYDELNRLTSRTYSDSTPSVSYKYDGQTLPSGFPAAFNRGYSTGRLVAVTYGGGSAGNYTGYDQLGRVNVSYQQTDGQNYGFSYGSNLAGQVTSETYPSLRQITTGYDTAGRISTINGQKTGEPNKAYAGQFSYAAHGAPTSIGLNVNGATPITREQTSYNSRLQPTQMELRKVSTNELLVGLDYEYGTASANNGNMSLQRIRIGTGTTITQTFAYDALNRLQSASENSGANWTEQFSYDRYGNMWVSGYTGITLGSLTPQLQTAFNAANNQIVLSNFAYDPAGNLTRDPTTVATNGVIYDAENRQTQYTKSGQPTSFYYYDGDGRRVKKVVNNETTVFVYDGGGRLIAEYISGTPSSGGTSYLTSDHLGSTRVVTDGNGIVKGRHDYLPFGEEIPSTVGGRGSVAGYGATEGIRQKFTQKERDSESGLDYFIARYYSSAQGRFTSSDEFQGGPDEVWVVGSGNSNKQALVYADVTEPQSLNKYQYCYNNPFRYVDLDGKWPSGIHKRILENAFPGLSKSQIRILVRASERVDKDQSESGSYKHAMRAPNQSTDESKSKTAEFIAQSEDKAKQFQREHEETGAKGLSNDALDAAGESLHTVTDATSPAHTDKQGNPEVWDLRGNTGRVVGNIARHTLKERKISPEQMKEGVNAARQEFGKIFGAEVLKQATTKPNIKEAPSKRRDD